MMLCVWGSRETGGVEDGGGCMGHIGNFEGNSRHGFEKWFGVPAGGAVSTVCLHAMPQEAQTLSTIMSEDVEHG